MGKMISELTGKLKTLSYRIKKTDEIIPKGDKEALERHQASIANGRFYARDVKVV